MSQLGGELNLDRGRCQAPRWQDRILPHTRSISMTRSRAVTTAARRARRRSARIALVWPRTRHGRRALRRVVRRVLAVLLAAPLAIRILIGVVAILAVWSAANWLYQVVRKPTELFFPVDGVLAKAPAETWRGYGPLFRRHSTAVITPELLAALAQVEGSGNPVARTYWRWRLTWNPFEVYQPAS